MLAKVTDFTIHQLLIKVRGAQHHHTFEQV